MKIKEFIDLLFPTLPDWEKEQSEELITEQQAVLDEIDNTSWGKETDTAFEEALRVVQEENNRAATAQSKATNILMFVAAFIPLLTIIEGSSWQSDLSAMPRWVSLLIYSISVTYLLAAVVWALRTTKRMAFHRVYPKDITEVWRGNNKYKKEALIRQHLKATLKNQEVVNRRVSAFAMSYSFVVRAIFSFSALVIVQFGFILFDIFNVDVQQIKSFFCCIDI